MAGREPTPARALVAVAVSLTALVLGFGLAASRFPDGFDWVYSPMSALASRKHNPEGAGFFALGLALSLAFLWPAVSWIAERDDARSGLGSFGKWALRLGIVLGVLVGFERLALHDFSKLVRKGHELLALASFLGLYLGILCLQAHRVRNAASSPWPACIAVAPLVAVGLSQLALYFDQRDLGWVDRSWREMGIPFWLSFAFWQWLAAAALWASLVHLVLARPASTPAPAD